MQVYWAGRTIENTVSDVFPGGAIAVTLTYLMAPSKVSPLVAAIHHGRDATGLRNMYNVSEK